MLQFFKKRIERYRNRNDRNFPNKCDICGLRVSYTNTDNQLDDVILTAGRLQRCGLAISYPRNINVSFGGSGNEDITHFCALSNIKYWNKPFKKCPDWQLRLDKVLSLSDYLAIHHSKNNTRIAIRLSILAAILTIIGILVSQC
jgi:hypothetical protein